MGAYWKCAVCNHIASEVSHGRHGCAVLMATHNRCGCKAPRGAALEAPTPSLRYIPQRLDDDPKNPIDTDVYVGWAAEVRQCVLRLGYKILPCHKILPCVDSMAPIVRADGSKAGYYTVYDNGRAEAEFYRNLRVPCDCKPRQCLARTRMEVKQVTSALLALADMSGAYVHRRGGR